MAFGGKKAAPFTASGRKSSHPHTAKGTPRKKKAPNPKGKGSGK